LRLWDPFAVAVHSPLQRVGSMKPYRENVGIVVLNARGEVLVGERVNFPGVFQFPQGGMDPGESPLAAARRELLEETGLRLAGAPALEIEDWLYYDFPENVSAKLKAYRGQKQKWFVFRWDGDPGTLRLDLHQREFERVRWARLDEIVAGIVAFKRPVYERVAREVSAFLARNSSPGLD
jgi:putative (di)nucleoside polyphosphate hydrolase